MKQIALYFFILIAPLSVFSMPTKEFIIENAVKVDHLDRLPNLLHQLAPFNIFLIGETHGTKESPEFCLGLVKLLVADAKRPLALALEISEVEQPIFDEFMLSGNPDVFSKSSLFTDKQPYGISSEAMVQLLTSLRPFKNVKVLCSLSKDLPSKATFQENQEERDLKWATFILKSFCSKQYSRVVVLGGAFHMSLVPQWIGKMPVKTMGYYLLHSKEGSLTSDQVLSIDIRSKEVNAWGCFVDTGTPDSINDLMPRQCGEMNFSNPNDNYSTALNWSSYFLMEAPMQDGYNATLFIRKLSASKPFVPLKY